MEKKKVTPEETVELTADEIADLSINLDIEKTAKEEALKELDDSNKKNEDLTKANARLMKRISEKVEKEDKDEEVSSNKKVKLSDLYNFSKGRLELKNKEV